MYICICNAITDKQVQEALDAGARNLWDLQTELGLASGCGSCKETAADMLRESRSAKRGSEPRIHVPSAAPA
jgi:bacterioferritin-associated ferredoxin